MCCLLCFPALDQLHLFKSDLLPFPIPHHFKLIPPRAQCLFKSVQLIIRTKVNKCFFLTEYLYKVEPYHNFKILGIVCIIDGVVH